MLYVYIYNNTHNKCTQLFIEYKYMVHALTSRNSIIGISSEFIIEYNYKFIKIWVWKGLIRFGNQPIQQWKVKARNLGRIFNKDQIENENCRINDQMTLRPLYYPNALIQRNKSKENET